jgi:hypothetical protein
MAQGISIHIGLNQVDSRHYRDGKGKPWKGILKACENDAKAMMALAQSKNFGTHLLLTKEATTQNVIATIEQAAEKLKPGDFLLLTYSGHGGQVPDMNNEPGEDDLLDETWCLFDRQFLDDELYHLWVHFRPYVRILMLSDSCHSGTMAKDPLMNMLDQTNGPAIRTLPLDVSEKTYQAHKDTYDTLQQEHPNSESALIEASVILISGCQDNQFSLDGPVNGLFTGALLSVWNEGKYSGSIRSFYKRIVRNMPYYQCPNLFKVGTRTTEFERRRPFDI